MTKYKSHYACFECRKTYKRRLLSDIVRKDDIELELKEAKCPQCGNLMANMGKDFEAPKKGAVKEWEHIKRLYSVGITFHSCGCNGPGYIPNTTESLIAYLQEIKKDYNYNLDFWRKREEPTDKNEIDRDNSNSKNWLFISKVTAEIRSKKGLIKNEDAKRYWIDRINEIDNKLERLKITTANTVYKP
jgi:DNA-directed RNA polymerase subunit RPC12/RpoP